MATPYNPVHAFVVNKAYASVAEFIEKDKKLPVGLLAADFLAVQDKNGRTNQDKLFSALPITTTQAEKTYFTQFPEKLPVPVGIELVLRWADIKAQLLSKVDTIDLNYPVFKAQTLVDLELDRGYKKTYHANKSFVDGKTYSDRQGLTVMAPNISVWAWVRALTPLGQPYLTGQLLDLTPFVRSVQTMLTKNGGSFSIELAPITCEWDTAGYWKPSAYHLKKDKEGGFLAETSITSPAKQRINAPLGASGTQETAKLLFHTVLQENDLVFIRYETLDLEADRLTTEALSRLSLANLPGKVYDLIGLVDKVPQTINYTLNQATVSVKGRDLMKLLIDEGSYFFASQFLQDQFKSSSYEGEFILRSLYGKLTFLSIFPYNPVEDVVKFVLGQLSKMEIVPSGLFAAYPDKLGKVTSDFPYEPTAQLEELATLKFLLEEQCASVIRVIRETADLDLNRGYDFKIKYDDAYILENYMSNVLKLFQYGYEQKTILLDSPDELYLGKTLVDFGLYTDYVLAGDKTQDYLQGLDLLKLEKRLYETKENADILARKVGYFSEQELKSIQDYLTKERQKLVLMVRRYAAEYTVLYNQVQEAQPEKPAENRGIWKITQVALDASAKTRLLVDASLSTATGSLSTFFQRICQEPFLEFYGDTYGDKYCWTIRKPPFDRDSYTSVLDGKVYVQSDDENKSDYVLDAPQLITVTADDVLDEALEFNHEEIYTWYHFVPKMTVFGASGDMSLFYFPPKAFDEYVKIWGSKPLQVIHQYWPSDIMLQEEVTSEGQALLVNAYKDYLFLIQSHAYLPFTRKGRLTLSGDRRLKLGNFIYYQPTNEIFHIDAVTQNFSTSGGELVRGTTLIVSRGMVKDYIKPRKVSGISKPVSYFTITTANEILIDDFKVRRKVNGKPSTSQPDVTRPSATPATPSVVRQPATQATKPAELVEQLVRQIKKAEGLRLRAYQDQGGFLTIGYGHKLSPAERKTYISQELPLQPDRTVAVPKKVLTQKEAEKLLYQDIMPRINAVFELFGEDMTYSQFSALFSLVFNTSNGPGFANKYQTFIKVCQEFFVFRTTEKALALQKVWAQTAVTVKGKPGKSPALLKRRQEEVALFFKNWQPVVSTSPVPSPQNQAVQVALGPEPEAERYSEDIDGSALLNAIKVNQDVFEFFLKRQQLR